MRSIHSISEKSIKLDDYVDDYEDTLSIHVLNDKIISYNRSVVALWGFKEGAKIATETLHDKQEINLYSGMRGKRLFHLKERLLKFKAEAIKL